MKQNSLTTAVIAGIAGVAGLAGVAQAVNLNPDGLGQVLIYPYYTVNAGNSTLISVVNTTERAKAVKVRFLESLNSAEVLDFNLYLSAFDVWTGNVSESGPTGAAQLSSSDRSCTVPTLTYPVVFREYEFTENNPDILGLLGTPGILRTRQGHVEIIEMGDLFNDGGNGFNPAAYATHSNGVPANCNALNAAWDGGIWDATGGAENVNAGSGGLFGSGVIIDGAFGRALSYNADAISGFFVPVGAGDNDGSTQDLHRPPGTINPSLNDVQTGPNVAVANIFDNGELITATFNVGVADAVSAVLTSRYIYNEYHLVPGLSSSEWVITFPTKRDHTYVPAGEDVRPFSDNSDVDSAANRDGRPFDTNGSPEPVKFNYWDREERVPQGGGLTVSPPRPGPQGLTLDWEANVLALGQDLATATTPSAVLGTTPQVGAKGLTPFVFQQGWARLEFDDTDAGFNNYLVSNDGIAIIGLPVVGFWVADFTNQNVEAGVRANYGVIHRHRADRDGRIVDVAPEFGTNLSEGLPSWTDSAL